MIKSVRMKLFIIITLFLTFLISITLVLNLKFLDKYYVHKNRAVFYSAYEQINNASAFGELALKDTMINVDRGEKIASIILFEGRPTIKYTSLLGLSEEVPDRAIPRNLSHLIFSRRDEVKTDYIYEVISFPHPKQGGGDDDRLRPPRPPNSEIHDLNESSNNKELDDLSGISDIVFAKELDTGEILILRKPLHDIIDNTKIANEFLIYIGIITITLGSVFIFFYSKRITRSIVDLSHIAKSIANLDFSKKYDVKSNDEIGVLGNSMNLISEELNKAMDELMVANDSLKEDIERKKQIDEMRKSFISSVSHELKSPIGITRGYVEGLKYNIANNEEIRNRYYDILIDEADKMDKLVRQLLNLSNLESEVFELEESLFNISVLVDEVIEKYSHVIQEKGVEAKVNIDDNYFVKADYLRIDQVLCNYVANALNHVDDNKYIEVRVQPIDERVRVSVINSGKKIPKEDLERLWDSFYKVDKARTREYGGTGLGLSIVKSIMEHHKGRYGVINKKIGVEFWFELNIIPEE